jgi:NAD(P)-dependent dehydrogenase (short-subunit alcohol dehydrogenase family)
VINLCQTSAYQYGGTNVRFNALCPGLIETGMTTTTFDSARKRGTSHKIGQLNPQKRYGLPSEIANVVAFIASDEASYMNGQAIAVDGGLSASHPIVPGRFH